MQRRRGVVVPVLLLASLAVVMALALTGGSTSASPSASAPATESEQGSESDAGIEPKGGSAEAEEEAAQTAERIEAWHQAKDSGTLRVQQAAAAAPAAGWTGEQVVSPTADDWEPAIAADPNAPFVYLLTTRYTGPTACGNKCPLPYIVLKVSSDGGATWGPDRYICTCSAVGAQADPIIEVVPNTGAVYSVFMNGYNVFFTKSTDHGATWSTPAKIYGKVSWNDKPILAESDNGQDIYVSFNGPTGGDPYVAQSHDGGTTWTQTKVVDSSRYFFAFDGDVLPNGNVVFSEASLDYSGPGGSLVGQSQIDVIRSTNKGSSWTNNVVDTVELSPNCTAAGCPDDYYPVTRRSPRTQAGISSSSMTARRPRTATTRCGRGARPTAVRPGRLVRRCRRAVRWATSRRSSRAAAATCARGTCRRTAATSTPGTSGTGHRPTAGRRGPRRSRSPTSRRARLTRRRTGSSSRTATTARWRSRTPARRSPLGARGTRTRDPAERGSTARRSRSVRRGGRWRPPPPWITRRRTARRSRRARKGQRRRSSAPAPLSTVPRRGSSTFRGPPRSRRPHPVRYWPRVRWGSARSPATMSHRTALSRPLSAEHPTLADIGEERTRTSRLSSGHAHDRTVCGPARSRKEISRRSPRWPRPPRDARRRHTARRGPALRAARTGWSPSSPT